MVHPIRKRSKFEYNLIIAGGALLNFNAGFINGTTLLQNRSVTTTHMTGNATMFGISLINWDLQSIRLYGALMLCYTGGSCISGLLIPYQNFSVSMGYGRVFLVVSACLFLASIIDVTNAHLYVYDDFLVALSMGMQNGMLSRYSNNILRIGHATGMVTDLGVLLGRQLGGLSEEHFLSGRSTGVGKANKWRCKILFLLLFSFSGGSVVSQLCHPYLGHYQLMMSAGVTLVVGVAYLVFLLVSKLHMSLHDAALGDVNNISSNSQEECTGADGGEVPDMPAWEKHNDCMTDDEDYMEAENFANCSDRDSESASPAIAMRGNNFCGRLNDTEAALTRSGEGEESYTEGPEVDVSLDSEKAVPTPAVVVTPLHERSVSEFILVITGGMILALNAGVFNAVAHLSEREVLVTHVSGSVTKCGLAIGRGEFGEASIALCMVLFFLLGSTTVGAMSPSSVFRLGISYGRVVLLTSILLGAATAIHIAYPNSWFFYYSAACGFGVQNAMVTKYSGGVVRTTHVTGALADIGSTIGRILTRHRADIWQLYLLIPIVACFIGGTAVGKLTFGTFGRYATLLNAGYMMIIGVCYVVYLKSVTHCHLSIVQLLLGKYTLRKHQSCSQELT